MQIKVFSIPLDLTEDQESEINDFLSSVRVISHQVVYVDKVASPGWAVCVTYEPLASKQTLVGLPNSANSVNSSSEKKGKPRVDYRELLSERDFSLFLDLKKLRKELAAEQGFQEFIVFTNEQLYEFVKKPVLSLAEMAEVRGVGAARVEKYGAQFLEILRASRANATDSQEADATDSQEADATDSQEADGSDARESNAEASAEPSE